MKVCDSAQQLAEHIVKELCECLGVPIERAKAQTEKIAVDIQRVVDHEREPQAEAGSN